MPVGKDMDGKVLTQVFDKKIIPEYIDTWETVEGNSGNHPETLKEDPLAAQESLKQLIELGYIEPADEDATKIATVRDAVNYIKTKMSE